MKKLKMIVSSVVVLAIVGSAFSFNANKILKFCVSPDSNSTDCSEVITNSRRTTTGDANRKYYVEWLGASELECTNFSTQCATRGRFLIE